MDGRPGARAADADAVGTSRILGDFGCDLDHFIEVLRGLDADLVEDLAIIGNVVELIAPRNAPLLGLAGAELGARDAVPCRRGPQSGQHVFPGERRIGFCGILDVGVEVLDPACRTVGPGHVRAGHEGVVLVRLRGQRRRHLVEIHVLRKDVVSDVHPGQRLERLDIADHRIDVRMLVQQELDRLAAVGLPVEIRGHCPRHGGCEGRVCGDACYTELGGAIQQITPADAFGGVGFEQVLLTIEHSFLPGCASYFPFRPLFFALPDVFSGLSEASA